jgi:predicted nucleotide-binding protein
MEKPKQQPKAVTKPQSESPRSGRRNFPHHSLEEALIIPQKIVDEMGGRPFKKLLLADALGISPSSSNFRDLLSSSFKYGLTNGTEKATEITLAETGTLVSQKNDPQKRMHALRKAALTPSIFKKFYEDYADRKLPSGEMIGKILTSEYGVDKNLTSEFTKILIDNGKFTGIIRDISGSPHVLLDADIEVENNKKEDHEGDNQIEKVEEQLEIKKVEQTIGGPELTIPKHSAIQEIPKAIFIGHGKNRAPLQKLQAMLSSFQIPHKVTIDEANLGRPIPQKVKDTMLQCGSAILIFTCDEKFFDENGNEIWRPSENVVHELGASSFAYGDRVVIFKEKGLHFPTNYQSIGYIEFEVDSIDSRTTDLLKELIGFGLVKITPL